MKISSKVRENERYEAPAGAVYLASRDRGTGNTVTKRESHNGVAAVEPAADAKPRLPSLDLDAPKEPVFPDNEWLSESARSLADHPLLRGLLLELPPKGTVPPPGWLDRWFEATRSILELLYTQER